MRKVWHREISRVFLLAISIMTTRKGGLKELTEAGPNVPIYVSREQWEVFGEHPFHASVEDCTPTHWPVDFNPVILQPGGEAVGPWGTSYPLTEDRRVLAVDTPGNAPGHMSLVVYGDCMDEDDSQTTTTTTTTTYLLTGDAVYGLDLLDVEQTLIQMFWRQGQSHV